MFHGGLNAALFDRIELLFAEMEKVIPVMKERGGYLISSDHSVPDSVSLKDFGRFIELAKKLGTY
jgi:uroporphyrinogen decarboxylase